MNSTTKLDLFLVSFLALFLEVALIRWVPSYERMLAYFTNCVLIAAFLGLGVGSMLARRSRDLMRYQSLLIFVLVAAAILVSTYVKTAPSVDDVVYSDFSRTARLRFSVETTLVIFFVLVGAQFVPLGQRIGKDLMRFGSPIRGYTVNLLGSLLGVVVFAAVSFLQLAPVWWFALVMAVLLWLVRTERNILGVSTVVCALTVGAVWAAGAGFIWSPYHKIAVTPLIVSREIGLIEGDPRGRNPNETADLPLAFGFHVTVDDDFLQVALNLSPSVVATNAFLKDYERLYDLPYRIPNFPYKDVLIVGAGTGNDTAAALRRGVERVDAVEIDPALVALGREGHPERPYEDPRVHVWVDDARSYFNKTRCRYDMVVFGLLDSHRLFSQMSSVRLDSFVFTLESFREVKRLLKPQGIVVVYHALGPKFMAARMCRMLTEAFGQPPVLISNRDRLSRWYTFITGPGATIYLPSLAMRDLPVAESATDDWPFFYLAGRHLPRDYAVALALMLVISVLAVIGGSQGKLRSVNLHFFFLGSAFLLLETLSVTRFALLFGSTWVVNSIVFTAILLVVLVANLWMTRLKSVNVHALYALLGACVLVNYWFPIHDLLRWELTMRLAVAMALTASPIFFAAFIFAHWFKRTTTPELAFASNLLGAVVGGLAEYSTMVIGFRRQLLIALALYALSYLALVAQNRSRLTIAA